MILVICKAQTFSLYKLITTVESDVYMDYLNYSPTISVVNLLGMNKNKYN